MDRATAGLVMTTEGKDRATVRITDVLENSPASEAGLQKDDILVSIDAKKQLIYRSAGWLKCSKSQRRTSSRSGAANKVCKYL